jgi:hypothetical protein
VDVETSEALERVGERIDALGISLRREIGAGDASLRGEMRAMGASLRGEMQAMGASLRDEMATMREELFSEFREGLAENRRHSQILFESVRDDIRMVAEGVAALSAKIETRPGS